MKKAILFMLLLLFIGSMSVPFVKSPNIYAAGVTSDSVKADSLDENDLINADDDPPDWYADPIFCPPVR